MSLNIHTPSEDIGNKSFNHVLVKLYLRCFIFHIELLKIVVLDNSLNQKPVLWEPLRFTYIFTIYSK